MGKVITGTGLQEFIESGKHEVIPDAKAVVKESAKEAEKVEIAKEPEKPVEPVDEEDGLTAEEKNETERIRKLIAKKHRAMKQEEALRLKAQEEASDAESFAKNQYDRARLAEERAATLEKQLNEAKPKQAEPELTKPDIKDFTDDKGQVRWTDYTEASSEYAAKKAVAAERTRQQSEALAQTKAQMEARVKEKLEAAKIQYPDFEQVVGGSSLMVPNAVLQYITESDFPADISYHLAKHPELVEKLSKLPPIKAIALVRDLERDQFDKPVKADASAPVIQVAPERGGAPPPITPIAGGSAGTVNTDPSKMSFQELRAFERTRNKKRQ